jgi:hypothetical protein
MTLKNLLGSRLAEPLPADLPALAHASNNCV